MNLMQLLSSQAWVERLGGSLVHFLWQGLAIAAVYAAARKGAMRAAGPNARYLLACAALALMMAAPLVTWALMAPAGGVPDPAYLIPGPLADPAAVAFTRVALPGSVLNVGSPQILPWVVLAWLVGALLFWMRLAGAWVATARMRSTQVRQAPPEWQRRLGTLGARIGVSRPVRLLISAMVQAPVVAGWLRPVVLVPVGALAGLPAAQMEALLLHELAHIRRHDYLVNILQSAAEALLFYHPAVWWVSGHMRAERELCCDDAAVAATGDVLTYARALAEIEAHRPAHLRSAVAASGGSLTRRIARLLGQSRPAARAGLGPGVLAVAILLATAAYGLFAQSAPHPAFQVASVKANTEANPQGMSVRPLAGGRLTTQNAPLMLLIQFAYSIEPFQLVGGPGWIHSDGYDIEAKPEGYADRQHVWLMLQTLLADRFKLSVHREMRDMPVYTMTAVKSGLKLPPPKECVPRMPDAPAPPPALQPGQMYCGGFGLAMLPTGLRMQGSGLSMAEFTKRLAAVVGRPVLDKTGFTGTFDVQLEFAPDDAHATDPARPDIFAAIEEHLGLKLTAAKGPVEVLVIDHAEKPTAN
jgi:uncharacterized protein (TIGR03435 family)